ncbi:MAG: HAMP domain-containing histidine kinase, partial [Anaerolineae bacterium]|nr:HAMP domain-containing histidine kinase [Anaerolineae bacterium]
MLPMLQQLNIRQRVLLTFIAVVLAGGVLQLLIAGRQLQLATLDFYQRRLETDALLISNTLAEPLEHFLEGENRDVVDQTLASLQQDGGHDYMIVDRSYRIVGYTGGGGFPATERAPQTPELVVASMDRIGADVRADYNGIDRLYVAVPLNYGQQILGYLVLSEPMQPAYAAVNKSWLELAGATVPVIGLVIVASLWISRTISRPIQRLRNSALRMADGALDTRIVVDSQDEIGQLGQTFNFMAEQVEALLKAQRSFVSNAAHELRTPLMTLKLRVDALLDENLDPDQRRLYLRETQQELEHMAELVSSLLVLARIDEGRHQPGGSVTDPAAALHDIARHWRIEAKQAGLHFEAQIEPDLNDLPLSLNDLRLIVENLLSNAVKYTKEGGISLKVEQQGPHLRLKVCDTGIGFTPEQHAHLFDRFYRADTARTRSQGTGLGLSITQSLLAESGGKIEAH